MINIRIRCNFTHNHSNNHTITIFYSPVVLINDRRTEEACSFIMFHQRPYLITATHPIIKRKRSRVKYTLLFISTRRCVTEFVGAFMGPYKYFRLKFSTMTILNLRIFDYLTQEAWSPHLIFAGVWCIDCFTWGVRVWMCYSQKWKIFRARKGPIGNRHPAPLLLHPSLSTR